MRLSIFKTIGVSHKTGVAPIPYTLDQFEYVFKLAYLSKVSFENWRIEKWIKTRCGQLEKKKAIHELPLWLGALHGKQSVLFPTENLSIRWISPKVGYGLFTEKRLAAWSFIGEYTGVIRERGLIFPKINDYCFMYPFTGRTLKRLTIDSETKGNYTRFINHSDIPNLESFLYFYEGLFHIGLRAIRPINSGEELTYDYGKIYWLYRNKS